MENPKSSAEQLRELFEKFNRKYLEDLLSQLEPVEINTAYEIAHNPDFEKTISEVKYNFCSN